MSQDSEVQPSPSQIRKDDHIDLCHRGDVTLSGDRGLWSDVSLIHNALPELKLSDVTLETEVWSARPIKAPLMLTGMTGGTDKAAMINRGLAQVCAHLGIPFGLGSQRIMSQDPSLADTFKVKKYAPEVNLISNLGINQARDLGIDAVRKLCDDVESDALAIHLNPAMEFIQPGSDADRDFTGGEQILEDLVSQLGRPIIVKECGCGLSPKVVVRLQNLGIKYVDVSGVGGTSWVKLEAQRALNMKEYSREARLGLLLADWGIPTAAAVMLAAPHAVKVIASGGVSNALDAAKALVLGADVVGMARPALQVYLNAYEEQGEEHAIQATIDALDEIIYGIRAITALHGVQHVRHLKHQDKVISGRLRDWAKL